MDWCAKVTRMSVRTNADTPEQAENAVAFGASGIGLCRTEHMFFEGDRIDAMREMILADKVDDRQKALAKLLPYQKGRFRRHFQSAQRTTGHNPFARSAVARISAARSRRPKRAGGQNGRERGRRSPGACTNCTNRTRCSAIAVADLGFRLPEVTRDAGARDFRSGCGSAEKRDQSESGNHDSARRL